MNLWFGNSFGKKRIIAQCSTPDEVNKAIDEFIAECNFKKARENGNYRPFVRYYTRIWEQDGLVKYDVGSHTEFFYWEGPISAYEVKKV